MSKWSIVGILLCISGVMMVGFQSLSKLMGQEGDWEFICLYDVVAPEKLEWIDTLTWLSLDRAADYIASTPLYILLLICGGVLMLISGFIKN